MTCHYPLEQLKLKRPTITSVHKDVRQPELSDTADGSVKWYALEKQAVSFQVNVQLLWEPAIPLLVIYPEEIKTYVPTKLACKCSKKLYHKRNKKLKKIQIPIDRWIDQQIFGISIQRKAIRQLK